MSKAKVYELIKKSYSVFLRCTGALFGVNFIKRMDSRLRFGRWINLRNPKTLADKVSYIGLHMLPADAVRCTDKWEARGYIANKGLEHILIPVYGQPVSSADELDFSLFPNQFVLKATHGCQMNFICRDKEQLSQEQCRKTANKWLNTTYGTYSVEPHYGSIQHRVYCESCVGKPGELVDYKIHCMNGKPSFILVCGDRIVEAGKGTSLSLYLYDIQWNPIDGLIGYHTEVPGCGTVPKPQKLDEMLEIARKLSEDFDFVRVDLYEVDGKIWFSELTFTPACGVFPYFTNKFLEDEGEKLILPDR